MVDFRRLSSRAKDLVDKRGGSESLKQDADELKRIAKGPGSMGDKAKAAMSALKEPGARGETGEPVAEPSPEPAPEAKAKSREKVAGESRGKHAHADKQGAGGGEAGV